MDYIKFVKQFVKMLVDGVLYGATGDHLDLKYNWDLNNGLVQYSNGSKLPRDHS